MLEGWRGPPLGNSSPPEYPPSASLLKPQDTTHRDGVQWKWGRASTTARQSRISLLFAAFSAISAMIFLVYMCSLLVRKIIKRAAFARRLDSIWRNRKCRVSDPSSTDSPGGTSLDDQQDIGLNIQPPLVPMLADELTADASSVEVTAGATAPLLPAETAEQVAANGGEEGPNWGGEEALGEGHWRGLLILEVPLHDGPLQPASPLDPGLHAFIDAVLLGSEAPLAESALLPADEPHNSDLPNRSAGSWPATSAAASGLDGSPPPSNVHQNLSARRPVPIILRRGRKRRIGDEQGSSPGPSTPQNISDGSAKAALGASVPGGRAPSNTVDEGPSMPPTTAKRPRGRRKQRFNVRQEPDPDPLSPQIMPHDSGRMSWIASAGTPAGGVSFQQHDPTAVPSSLDDPNAVPQLLLPARIMDTGGELRADIEGFLPNSEVLNEELAEVPSVNPSAAPHSSSPGDTSA
ncbi:hypothetical protein EAH_00067550 [Eimeria acervulina]|uniref:Uncharacterized protein n=1 Tax=Eimeria acervulina TaxID=5801 RepID=U6GTW8_EIMAC|nr:hypothetical protein EAH_00067550 [Eimeria acervulina]CDI82748.1 hypothetical protein EAH_00067550 [Eimeria acervulina]